MTDFARLAAKLEAAKRDLNGTPAMMRRIGAQLAPLVDEAVRSDIGDQSMSGWRRGKPVPIRGRYNVKDEASVEIVPTAKGHMRVLEDGRNRGNAGGMAGPGVSADGTTRRTNSGAVVRARRRKARRWNGVTDGKGTWTDATKEITDRGPKVASDELTSAMARHFTRG